MRSALPSAIGKTHPAYARFAKFVQLNADIVWQHAQTTPSGPLFGLVWHGATGGDGPTVVTHTSALDALVSAASLQW